MNQFNAKGQDLRNKLDILGDVYAKQTLDDATANLLLDIVSNERLINTVHDTERERVFKAGIHHITSHPSTI